MILSYQKFVGKNKDKKMTTPKKTNKDQEKSKKLKLNKKTLKDLNPIDEKVKGGVGGTAPISNTCRTVCKGNC
jgi:hypothetical protein